MVVSTRERSDVPSQLATLGEGGIDWARAAPGRLMAARPGARESAVLVLFGRRADDPAHSPLEDASPESCDVLLLRRAATLRSHPGQIGFPGGRTEPADASSSATALREAAEETGLDPAGVDAFTPLPRLPLAVSNHLVTPVPAWWRAPSPVRAVDERETAEVFRAHLSDLLDPTCRASVRRVRGIRTPAMPAFVVDGRLIWGFTAFILSGMFDALGWSRPWDASRTVDPQV